MCIHAHPHYPQEKISLNVSVLYFHQSITISSTNKNAGLPFPPCQEGIAFSDKATTRTNRVLTGVKASLCSHMPSLSDCFIAGYSSETTFVKLLPSSETSTASPLASNTQSPFAAKAAIETLEISVG